MLIQTLNRGSRAAAPRSHPHLLLNPDRPHLRRYSYLADTPAQGDTLLRRIGARQCRLSRGGAARPPQRQDHLVHQIGGSEGRRRAAWLSRSLTRHLQAFDVYARRKGIVARPIPSRSGRVRLSWPRRPRPNGRRIGLGSPFPGADDAATEAGYTLGNLLSGPFAGPPAIRLVAAVPDLDISNPLEHHAPPCRTDRISPRSAAVHDDPSSTSSCCRNSCRGPPGIDAAEAFRRPRVLYPDSYTKPIVASARDL